MKPSVRPAYKDSQYHYAQANGPVPPCLRSLLTSALFTGIESEMDGRLKVDILAFLQNMLMSDIDRRTGVIEALSLFKKLLSIPLVDAVSLPQGFEQHSFFGPATSGSNAQDSGAEPGPGTDRNPGMGVVKSPGSRITLR